MKNTFGLDAFWESCDRDSVGDNPLERELAFRSDALQRYRAQIEAAEELGDDEAVAVLSRHFENTRVIMRRLREEILRQQSKATI